MTQLFLTSGDLYAPPHLLWKAGLNPPVGAGRAYTRRWEGGAQQARLVSRSQIT